MQFKGESANGNEEREKHAVVEEDVEFCGPGDGDEAKRESGPGDQAGTAEEIGIGEEDERGGAEIGEEGGGVELLVEGEGIGGCDRGGGSCAWPGLSEASEAEIDVIEEEGDGQGESEEIAGPGIEIEDAETEEAEDQNGVALQAPVAGFPVHADFEKREGEERPIEGDAA